MTIKDLSVNIAHLDRNSLLSDWLWLIGANNLPVLITAAGDAFVQNSETGSVSFLDTVEGTLSEIAADGAEFEQLLSDQDFVMQHFAVQLIAPLLKDGRGPATGQILSFAKPPVLGGEYDRANLEPADIEVHFGMLGQIWAQVSKLPPGTPINDITIR